MQEAHKLQLQDEGVAVPVCIRPSLCLASCPFACLYMCLCKGASVRLCVCDQRTSMRELNDNDLVCLVRTHKHARLPCFACRIKLFCSFYLLAQNGIVATSSKGHQLVATGTLLINFCRAMQTPDVVSDRCMSSTAILKFDLGGCRCTFSIFLQPLAGATGQAQRKQWMRGLEMSSR